MEQGALDIAEATMPQIPYFKEMLVFLLASVTIVPLLQRLKASPVLGYLAVGLVIGPHGLALIQESEGIETFAKLGVVFLLFMIGIKLSLERLITMRKYVFGLGTLQILVTGTVIASIARLWGNTPEVSILLGGCFALSSTAIVSQMLMERNALTSVKGRTVLSILLAQDIAIVPLLVLANAFTQPHTGSSGLVMALGIAAVKAVVAITVILLLGRLLLRPLFKSVNELTHSPELFIAMTLLVLFLTSALTSMMGLSMELGAFLAGLMLAETEFHNRIETDIRPFQGLLLGLFFITVGMSIDVHAVMGQFFWLVLSVIGLLVIKSFITTALCLAFKLEPAVAVPSGLLLGQAGEFLYIVVGVAMASQIMPADVGHFMLLVTALSMIATPFFSLFADALEKQILKRKIAMQET
jgi:monovalent cation:H+ antiporter-2, CPA2 family